MFDTGLSTQQLDVISALSSGATMTSAATQAGVHRNTINYWRRNLLPFQHALASAQYDKAMPFRERIEELADVAFQTLRDILTDPSASPGVRLKAALAIINTASTPPDPKKQIELDIERVAVQKTAPKVHTNAQAAQPGSLHKDAQSDVVPTPATASDPSCLTHEPTPQSVHNFAQTPYRRETPKIGRNEACPCGSGKKFKRCCIDQPLRAAA
jgi:transposase-like protein